MVSSEDKSQMIERIARYNNASDRRDVEAHVAAYTEDGVITGGMGTTQNGKDGLREALPAMFEGEGTEKRHLASNHEFDEQGDDRVSVHYVLTVLEAGTSPGVVATAGIVDSFVHTDGKWLVREHEISIDPSFSFLAHPSESSGVM